MTEVGSNVGSTAFVQFLLYMFHVFTLLGGSTCGGDDKGIKNFNWKT